MAHYIVTNRDFVEDQNGKLSCNPEVVNDVRAVLSGRLPEEIGNYERHPDKQDLARTPVTAGR